MNGNEKSIFDLTDVRLLGRTNKIKKNKCTNNDNLTNDNFINNDCDNININGNHIINYGINRRDAMVI